MVKELDFTDREESDIKTEAGLLRKYLGTRDSKFQRNLNRYYNNGKGAVDSIYTMYTVAQGYQPSYQTRDGVQTSINILKSCIDTVVSKISQAKVRPFLNPVRGDYDTIRACREGQQFFDSFYESAGIYKQSAEVMRDAMIFEVGIFHADNEEMTVRRALPWDVYIDPAEYHYGGVKALTRALFVEREYPARLLAKRYPDLAKKIRGVDFSNVNARYELSTMYDTVRGKKYQFYEGHLFRVTEYNASRVPFVFLFWTKPVKGFQTTSLIDELYTIQCQIDEVQLRIDSACRRALFNTTYLPSGGEVKESKLSNDAGLLVRYNPGPDGGMPTVSTPPAISNQYLELLNMYVSKAYEIAGISQINAQGKIPSNVKSGVMMESLDSLQSDRHNVTLQSYIAMLLEVAEVAVECFPDDADVIPGGNKKGAIKWKDIKKQRESFQMQFSAGSSLAKDPATKIEQIQQLQALGLNLTGILPSLLEMPDLESAYSVLTASRDYCMSVIDNVVKTGSVDFMPIIDLDTLHSECIRMLNRLGADQGNEKDIASIKKLLDKIEQVQTEATPVAPPMVPPSPAPIPMQGGV